MSKLINKELKYKGWRFSVSKTTWEDENKKIYERDFIETFNAAIILPITENNEVVFIKEFREIIGEEILEIPAGIIEPGEAPIEAAKRELEEEAGLKADIIEPLIDVYASGGFSNEKHFLFYAKELKPGKKHLDENEQIADELIKIPIERCIELIKQNTFKHENTNLAILLYYLQQYNKHKILIDNID